MKPSTIPVIIASIANTGAFVVGKDLYAVTAAVVSTVAIVVTVMNWIDQRIKKQLEHFAQLQDQKYAALEKRFEDWQELAGHKKR
jgi:ribosomal protein L30E